MRIMGLEAPILGWTAIEVRTQALMRLLEAKGPEIRAYVGVSWRFMEMNGGLGKGVKKWCQTRMALT